MNLIKDEGAVFTPSNIVNLMCTILRIDTEQILDKKIMEPSFGEGAFLIPIITYIIEYAREKKYSDEKIIKIIKNNVFGIEKNQDFYNTTILKINRLLRKHKLPQIKTFPNLICGDTLEISQFDGKCDVVIGNPPYQKIHRIKNREKIKKLSFTKSGMTDLYIAFFEKGIQMLNDTGRLCYITPNSFFTSSAGKEMRNYFVENNILQSIINFEHTQIFKNITTYVCITVLNKEFAEPIMSYESAKNSAVLLYNDFYINGKFYFAPEEFAQEFKNIINYDGEKYTEVKNGYATLLDGFFIGSEIAEQSKFIIPVVKASTGIKNKCFFPYTQQLQTVSLQQIQLEEPVTYQLLVDNKEKLENRSIDAKQQWYEFGRTQALKDTYKNKIAITNLYKTLKDIKCFDCPSGTGVYGGLYILSDLSEKKVLKILKTKQFLQYAKTIGKYKSGGYYTLSSKDIEQYINYSIYKEQLKCKM